MLKLLHYLSTKYFEVFELNDEGLYWNTWDLNLLQQQFGKYEYALKAVTKALEGFHAEPGESASSLADRLEQYLKNKLDNKDTI